MLVKQHLNARLLLAVAAAIVSILFLSTSVLAEDADNSTANTLKVTPVRTDITANPGETKTVEVTVTNPSDSDVVVRAIQNDFVAGDEDGTPALILDENEFAPKRSLKRFMRPLKNVTLPAGESRTVDVVIAVPKNANAGGYFGALRFAPTSPNDGGQVNLSASVASLILLRVSGDAAEKLTMTEFALTQNGNTGSFFTSQDDVAAHVRFKNDGDVQLGPIGKVSVTKGGNVVYEADFNNGDQREVVLPDSARRWAIPLNDLTGFGQYKVSATFTYGSKNQTVEAEQTFWVIPMSYLIGAITAIVLLVAAIVGFVLYRKRSKRKMSLNRRRK